MNISPLKAYLRPNGSWGLRNHVLVLPLHSALSSSARAIEEASQGAVAITHDWSGEIDADLERIISTLAGFASNPNNFATIFLTLDSPNERRIIERAESLGLPNVVHLSLADAGSMHKLVDVGILEADQLLTRALLQERIPAPWSAIVLGLECGGSDALSGITANPALGVASDMLVDLGATSILGETTEILGAEHLLAARAITPEVGVEIVNTVLRYE
ncbi:MAG: altronate dehydratase, partial [Actinobacteria bacterium]|nr:altronate dehydratase [Actinomycetota bacterium]